MVFKGPIQPGTSEKVFRDTGKSKRLVQGPVRPETDVKVFRETGRRVSGGGGRKRQVGPTRADFEAQQKIVEAQQAAKIKQEASEKRIAEQRQIARKEKIEAGRVSGQLASDKKTVGGFRVGLSDKERSMTTGQVIKGRFREVGSGLVSAGGTLVEGAVSLAGSFGTQTIEFDDSGKRIDKSFRFSEESVVGKARAEPSGTGKILGQAGVFLPLAGAATAGFVSGVATEGLKQTAIKTATEFSPFKIKPQTFGTLTSTSSVDDLKFDVASFKSAKADTTTRVVLGKASNADDVILVSKQISKGGVSVAQTEITAPTTRFDTGKFTEGVQFVKTESLAKGIGSGQVGLKTSGKDFIVGQNLESLTGGAGRVATRTRANIFFDQSGRLAGDVNLGSLQFNVPSTTGAISKSVKPGASKFAAGKGRRITQIGRESISSKVRIDDFNIRGVEFDVGVLSKGGGVSVSTGKTGVGGSGLQTSAKQISASISDIAPVSSVKPQGLISQVSEASSLSIPALSSFKPTSSSKPQVVLKEQPLQSSPLIDVSIKSVSDFEISPKSKVSPKIKTGSSFKQPLASQFSPAFSPALATDVLQSPKSALESLQQPKLSPAKGKPSSPFFDILGGAGVLGAGAFGGFVSPKFTSKKRIIKGKRRIKERISPSLTGQTLFDLGGITGGELELSGTGGRSPFAPRLVPGSRRSRKRKKKK